MPAQEGDWISHMPTEDALRHTQRQMHLRPVNHCMVFPSGTVAYSHCMWQGTLWTKYEISFRTLAEVSTSDLSPVASKSVLSDKGGGGLVSDSNSDRTVQMSRVWMEEGCIAMLRWIENVCELQGMNAYTLPEQLLEKLSCGSWLMIPLRPAYRPVSRVVSSNSVWDTFLFLLDPV